MGGQTTPPSLSEPFPTISPELARLLRPLFSSASPNCGIAVAVIRGTERTVACRGYSDRAVERPVRADTRFELGSVTKTFTALLLAEMVARGEVRYDDPIDRYLPADAVPGYPHDRPITLLHLATHTSGLPRLPVGLAPTAVPRWFTNPYATFSAAHLLRALPRTPVRGMPGAQVRYSSLGCGLLGLVLENAADLRYEELLASRVCGPLGLVDTSCGPGREALTGYRRGRRVPSFRLPALPGAAALRSTADDMLRFLQAHLAVDAVPIPEQTGAGAALRAALRDVSKPRVEHRRTGARICLIWNQRLSAEGDLVFQSGSTRSFSAFAGFNPAAQVGLVAMASTLPGLRRRFTQTAYEMLRRLSG
ncbi:serine hydrolase domain-containing protein [Kitasatospora sp. MAP5-34]|uniref:serine hydrolase domain-containing protein n=1 Tax=Kitasatospora sp. MAP5-34 TaxID=3035102 RepID=UPI00247705E4|nr:serine hydrolase domain-containing protein [Kitasatospora sp. MAP5-34]